MDEVLREVGIEAGERAFNGGRLVQGRHEALGYPVGGLQVAAAGAVKHPQVEAAGVAEAGHGGRREKLNLRVGDVAGFGPELVDNIGGRFLALVPGGQVYHAHAVGGPGHVVHQAIAGQGRNGLHRLEGLGHALHLVEHALGAFDGGTGRGRHVDVHHALVLGGDEAGGQNGADAPGGGEEKHQQAHRHQPARGQHAHQPLVAPGKGLVAAVEAGKEPAQQPRALGIRLRLFQQQRAQRGREGQRVHPRNDDGNGQRERELAVEHAHRAAHERNRNKHR